MTAVRHGRPGLGSARGMAVRVFSAARRISSSRASATARRAGSALARR
jgi:hypothetical protein